MTLEEIKAGVAGGSISTERAIELLNEYIEANPDDDAALTCRGMRYWSLNRRSEAINDYLAAVKANPESEARNALKVTYDILNFYNKDLYNP